LHWLLRSRTDPSVVLQLPSDLVARSACQTSQSVCSPSQSSAHIPRTRLRPTAVSALMVRSSRRALRPMTSTRPGTRGTTLRTQPLAPRAQWSMSAADTLASGAAILPCLFRRVTVATQDADRRAFRVRNRDLRASRAAPRGAARFVMAEARPPCTRPRAWWPRRRRRPETSGDLPQPRNAPAGAPLPERTPTCQGNKTLERPRRTRDTPLLPRSAC
jgi:hypothetical protein